MSTVLGLRKSTGLNELVALDGGIAGERQVVLAETKVVALPYLFGVVLAFEAVVGLRVGDELDGSQEQGNARHETHEDSAHSRLHQDLPEPSLPTRSTDCWDSPSIRN